MTNRDYGERQTCARCGQEVEWLGVHGGWRDRGGNRECPPYTVNGETVTPRKGLKHRLYDAYRARTKIKG